MKNKLMYLVKVSLRKKIKTKAFLFSNIVIAILVIGLINFDNIVSFFGGEFDKPTTIYVIDNTERSFELFENNLKTINETISELKKLEIKAYSNTLEEAIEDVKEKNAILVLINPDPELYITVEVISNEYIDTILYQILVGAINNIKMTIAMFENDIDEETYKKIYSPVDIKRTILDEEKAAEDENLEAMMAGVLPILILPAFTLLVTMVQTLGMEIADEKSSRGMEIIISSVSPQTHFFSKIISGNLFIVTQGLLLILYGGVGILSRKIFGSVEGLIPPEIINEITKLIPQLFTTEFIIIIIFAIILILLAFLLYSLIAAIAAAMTVNVEDSQQLQTPITILLLMGFYSAMFSWMFKGSLFIKILSYIPFISPFLVPVLAIMNQITIVDILISLGVLVGTIALIMYFGMGIYKTAILNYSNTKIWDRAISIIKNRKNA
jgi:ABC-2 type transport system permease protein